MRHVRDDLRLIKGPAGLAEKVEQQSFKVANQEGQLKHLEAKLQQAGLGKGERPCWVKPDGTIEFLLDVVLSSGGIRMRENVFPHRGKERSRCQCRRVIPLR